MRIRPFIIAAIALPVLLCACGQEKKQIAPDSGDVKTDIPTAAVEPIQEAQPNTNSGKLIAIDPGHQAPEVDMSDTEPDGPGSSTMKMKATGGTEGAFSGIPEYALNLDISKMLKDELENRGYKVLLTRDDNQTAISNAERAQLANNAGADLYLRIHANGSESSQSEGALALIPSENNPYISALYKESKSFAEKVLESYCEETGFSNQGLQETDTMTGINWIKVPVMILEMGFMTNEHDDMAMADQSFREKMVKGIANGLDSYFEKAPENNVIVPESPVQEPVAAQGADKTEPSLNEALQEMASEAEQNNGKWSIAVETVNSGAFTAVNQRPQQSASLIKLFIAAKAETERETLESQEQYQGETSDLIFRMLSVSDNDAANTITKRLGNGDAETGMSKVTSYCAANGYNDTSMGRLMLDFTAETDNYTSTKDCCNLLKAAVLGQLEGSDEIISALKQQERKSKIPSGIPQGVVTANKTGELDDVENDAAIIWASGETYIICVMSEDLASTEAARNKITEISSETYKIMNQS